MRPGPWTCATLALAALAADEVLRPDVAHAPGRAPVAPRTDSGAGAPSLDAPSADEALPADATVPADERDER